MKRDVIMPPKTNSNTSKNDDDNGDDLRKGAYDDIAAVIEGRKERKRPGRPKTRVPPRFQRELEPTDDEILDAVEGRIEDPAHPEATPMIDPFAGEQTDASLFFNPEEYPGAQDITRIVEPGYEDNQEDNAPDDPEEPSLSPSATPLPPEESPRTQSPPHPHSTPNIRRREMTQMQSAVTLPPPPTSIKRRREPHYNNETHYQDEDFFDDGSQYTPQPAPRRQPPRVSPDYDRYGRPVPHTMADVVPRDVEVPKRKGLLESLSRKKEAPLPPHLAPAVPRNPEGQCLTQQTPENHPVSKKLKISRGLALLCLGLLAVYAGTVLPEESISVYSYSSITLVVGVVLIFEGIKKFF